MFTTQPTYDGDILDEESFETFNNYHVASGVAEEQLTPRRPVTI